MMARARNIKPGFFKNEDLAECSVWARYIFPGLWMLADREGRLEDRPKRIKGEILPFDSVEVGPLLDELQQHGFILRYEVDGVGIIQVLAFNKHQNPHHREPPSTLPPPQSPRLAPVGNPPKPEAHPGTHEPKARGQPEASPGLDPPKSDLARGSSRADSLIPDSGFLNPDSKQRRARAREPDAAGPPPSAAPPVNGHPASQDEAAVAFVAAVAAAPPGDPAIRASRAGRIAVLLRREGVVATGSHPQVIEWAAAGVTDAQIAEAVAIARLRKPVPQSVPVAYVATIIEAEVLRPKPKDKVDTWWASEDGIVRKAREVGIPESRWPGTYAELAAMVRQQQQQRGVKDGVSQRG